MTCDCGRKMKVKFTTPLTKARYRLYRCECGETEETLEIPESLLSEDEKAALKRGREGRFLFYKRFKVKG